MGYLLEFVLLPGPLDELVRAGGVVNVEDLDKLPLVGSLQHASSSGEGFRSCIAECVGDFLADAMFCRPGVDPAPDEGSYPTFGGLTVDESQQALDRVAERIASGGPFDDQDCRTWIFELRQILSESVESGRDVVTCYG